MRSYIIRRLLLLIPTLLGITMVIFLAIQSIPGDPIEAYLGQYYEEELAASLRRQYGLDKPVYVQYVLWLGRLARGDWGKEVLSGLPVLEQILERLPISLELIFGAMIVALMVALPAGIISATRPYTASDYTAMTSSMVGISVPEFFGGILLVLLFSLGLGILPVQGYKPWSQGAAEHVTHMVLPVLTLGLTRGALLTRMVRGCMLEVVGLDYVKTARAKGSPEFLVICKHALKNALIPVVTVMGLQVGFLVGGSIVVETIFSVPGLGQYGINAIASRDYPAVMGFILVSSSIFVLANLTVDLVYAFLDPRIRYEN
ncbi:MAG: ABC transporter permease [Candidatus Tectomicrobia bacterium]|uniref:ABC transporter permease n=1 Tax=Tectimicrobiota bacterium TaxID=2528274 RepID=A0A932I0J5_UNCTE|nr:ABC transporter permease [Candidatus Tectomicrobia bacterium]